MAPPVHQHAESRLYEREFLHYNRIITYSRYRNAAKCKSQTVLLTVDQLVSCMCICLLKDLMDFSSSMRAQILKKVATCSFIYLPT
jgi:hypothetical protein